MIKITGHCYRCQKYYGILEEIWTLTDLWGFILNRQTLPEIMEVEWNRQTQGTKE